MSFIAVICGSNVQILCGLRQTGADFPASHVAVLVGQSVINHVEMQKKQCKTLRTADCVRAVCCKLE